MPIPGVTMKRCPACNTQFGQCQCERGGGYLSIERRQGLDPTLPGLRVALNWACFGWASLGLLIYTRRKK